MSWTSPQICYVPIRSPGDGGGSKGRKTEWQKYKNFTQQRFQNKIPKRLNSKRDLHDGNWSQIKMQLISKRTNTK